MIVVTGATGNVGRHVVDELVAAGAEVRALTRDPDSARLPEGVRVARTADLPLEGADAVFLNPAVVWDKGPGELLREAARAGVRRIVTLSSSSVLHPGPGNDIGNHHHELETEIEASGLAWTHVRPGAFASNALQWAEQIRKGDVVYGPYAQAHTAPIHEADIAAVAARALLGEDHAGQAPVLSGPQSLTFAEQVSIIGEALGRPLRYEEIPPEAAREAMTGGGLPANVADTLLRMYAGFVGRPAEISAETERITGRPGRTFAQWASDHAAAFS
ncbi:NAD(P)H-binding protein [Streptomyces sp. ME19-01-6]|uniref:NAD(P)H-binding protein n=1 Tax=Streptomyces sp. ME19-01-6 TaxID=3028686 RepID=UPI0029A41839|nr:NAD(P)H-binding protein [Streptomyces sp. ME19-01-6]MDX3226308.1 NAD(P)H-binding protein [Streptomyces sp. ME19-01-6]